MRVTRLINVMESAAIPYGIGSHTPQPHGVNASDALRRDLGHNPTTRKPCHEEYASDG